MRRPHLSIGKRLIHIIALLVCWGLYGMGLYYISFLPSDVYEGVLIAVGIELVLLLILTVSWIRRHLFFHRTLKPRTGIPSLPWHYTQDLLGYTVKGITEELKNNKVVVIDCDDTSHTKHYEGNKERPHHV